MQDKTVPSRRIDDSNVIKAMALLAVHLSVYHTLGQLLMCGLEPYQQRDRQAVVEVGAEASGARLCFLLWGVSRGTGHAECSHVRWLGL